MHAAQHAAGAGDALKDETHALPGNVGPVDQLASSDAADSAAQAAASKHRTEEAAVAAEAAQLRCSLHALQNGGYIVTRQAWGLSRRLDSLDQVRRLLRLMGRREGRCAMTATILSPDALARVQCRLRRLGFGLAPLPFGGVLVERVLHDTGTSHVIGRAESLAELQSFFPDFEQVLPEFWT